MKQNIVWSDESSEPRTYAWSIARKVVTIKDVSAKDKIYDGTLLAEIDGTPRIDGVINDESVDIIYGDAEFCSKEVGFHTV